MRRARIALALVLLLVPFQAFAQVCQNSEKIIDCWERLNPSDLQAAATVADSTRNDVAKANTGVSTIDSPINSALRDFLSAFSTSVASSKLSQNGNTLTLDWNAAMAPLAPGNVVKLEAVFTQPALDPTFKTQLTGKSDFDSINNSLNDLDDVELSATYAPTTVRFGRALQPHRPLLVAVATAARKAAPRPVQFGQLLTLLSSLQNEPPFKGLTDPTSVTFSAVTDDVARGKIESLVASAALQEKNVSELIRSQIDPFRKLLSNQPQLYASALGHFRKSIVGAGQAVFKVTYERGGTSLKDFYATPGGSECTPAALSDPNAKAGLGKTCAARFETYATAESVKAGAAATGRFAFSAEYDWTNSNKISEPQDMISISTPRSHKAVGSVVYGAVLTRDAQNHEGRFDLNLSYETNSGTGLKNRVIGSAVYSHQLSDTLTLPIGIVYANHPGDLPTADKKISVNFGLVYKLMSVTKPSGGT